MYDLEGEQENYTLLALHNSDYFIVEEIKPSPFSPCKTPILTLDVIEPISIKNKNYMKEK